MDTTQIINEFRNGDNQHRMHLYMAFRNFRPIFEQIEDEEAHITNGQMNESVELNEFTLKLERMCSYFRLNRLHPRLCCRKWS